MTQGLIYMVDPDGGLRRMTPSAPENEDRMQALVARCPELITDGDGDLLLVKREQSIADGDGGDGRWSLDRLFVTRDGVPVLVEQMRHAVRAVELRWFTGEDARARSTARSEGPMGSCSIPSTSGRMGPSCRYRCSGCNPGPPFGGGRPSTAPRHPRRSRGACHDQEPRGLPAFKVALLADTGVASRVEAWLAAALAQMR